jgi:hypothetical protein
MEYYSDWGGKRNSSISENMDESWTHYVKWNMSVTYECHIFYLYEVCEVSNYRSEGRTLIARGCGEGEMGVVFCT